MTSDMASEAATSAAPAGDVAAHGDAGEYIVVLYYKYVRLGETPAELEAVGADQQALCSSLQLTGRVRLALEGINGTLGGSFSAVQQYIAHMQASPLFQDVDWKTSTSRVPPFEDLQVRCGTEIVALELSEDQYDLSKRGTHLTPEEFRQAQQSGDVAVIDVRNTYEYNVGHFDGALNPKTRRFGQFPLWVRQELPTLQQKDKVLMYCTGGIRCEKASAYLRQLGLPNVYQLQGGIHRYLEHFPDGGGVFHGKNFVFDRRVAMASQDETVTGQCERCKTPHDVVSGTRCAYCRTHVLLCEACTTTLGADAEGDATDVFCGEHLLLVSGDVPELEMRVKTLQEALQDEQGRAKKGRRRSLRKQLDAVHGRIQRLEAGKAAPLEA